MVVARTPRAPGRSDGLARVLRRRSSAARMRRPPAWIWRSARQLNVQSARRASAIIRPIAATDASSQRLDHPCSERCGTRRPAATLRQRPGIPSLCAASATPTTHTLLILLQAGHGDGAGRSSPARGRDRSEYSALAQDALVPRGHRSPLLTAISGDAPLLGARSKNASVRRSPVEKSSGRIVRRRATAWHRWRGYRVPIENSLQLARYSECPEGWPAGGPLAGSRHQAPPSGSDRPQG